MDKSKKPKIKLISERAKKIWKGSGKEAWTSAIKRATNELKKEGKI
jgi:hypothetical protein